MNTYLTAMTEKVQEKRGTIDKYNRDAIMAFWARRSPIPTMPRTRWRRHRHAEGPPGPRTRRSPSAAAAPAHRRRPELAA